MEEIIVKTFDFNSKELCELINDYQEKRLELGLEKGYPCSGQQVKSSFGVFTDPELLIGAYHGSKLVGIIGAASSLVEFRGESMKVGCVGHCMFNPKIISELLQGKNDEDKSQFKANGLKIFQKLIAEVIKRATNSGIDFLYAFPILEETDLIAKYLEEEGGWLCFNKNVENVTKLMGSEGVDIIKEKRGLNIVEASAAKLVAKMKKDRISSGKLREASQDDFPKILDLLNNYSKFHELARIWTLQELQVYVEALDELKQNRYESKEEYPDTPFGSGITVWEDDKVIKAVVIFELNESYLKHGFAPILTIHQLAFSNDILELETNVANQLKRDFLSTFLAPYHNKVATTYTELPYYDEKAFKGFLGERRTTRFLGKILSEKAASFEVVKKLKKFYLNYVGFTI